MSSIPSPDIWRWHLTAASPLASSLEVIHGCNFLHLLGLPAQQQAWGLCVVSGTFDDNSFAPLTRTTVLKVFRKVPDFDLLCICVYSCLFILHSPMHHWEAIDFSAWWALAFFSNYTWKLLLVDKQMHPRFQPQRNLQTSNGRVISRAYTLSLFSVLEINDSASY